MTGGSATAIRQRRPNFARKADRNAAPARGGDWLEPRDGVSFIAFVLVVDDEPEIGAIIAETLKPAGFQVVRASGFWEALHHLETRHFDLMITDVMLPGAFNGLELAVYARSRDPALKSLFISGCSEPMMDNREQDDFVAKPFRPRELLGCAFELLFRRPLGQCCGVDRQDAARAVIAKVEALRPAR